MRRSTVLLLALAAFAGCGEGGSDSGRLPVVATTTQLGDFARQVGGDRASVHQILPANADPHDYEPRPSDARDLERARVVLRSGGDLDEWLGELIDSSGTSAAIVEPFHAGSDPHWWQDPRNAEAAVRSIQRALTKADPGGRDVYRRNARAYVARLRALDAAVAACIERLPRGARRLVTTHDALGYYADRYGLEVVGAVIPSLSSQAQPSSKDVAKLVDQVRAQKVKAIFPESSLNSKLERAIAREAGVAVGGKLWADTLGPEGSSGATYIESIESNTDTIVEGLRNGRPGSARAASHRGQRRRSSPCRRGA